MKFETALSTIREFGGRMKRISYPEVDYFIDRNKNVLLLGVGDSFSSFLKTIMILII